MSTMNKFAAMQALMNGEISEMISPDGKHKYAMVDGSIVTPRKKALDMKDMMEEGWSGKTPLSWIDHIGDGIFCIDEETQNTCSFPLLITSFNDNAGVDVNGTEWHNLRPVTVDELMAYVWDAEAVEKQILKDEKKVASAKKKETEVKEEAQESTETAPIPDPEPEVKEVKEKAPEPIVAPETAEMGNVDSSPQPSKENTALPKAVAGEIDSGVAQRKRFFNSLGLTNEDGVWEGFVLHYNLTDASIEEFAGRPVSDNIKSIQDYLNPPKKD